MKGRGFRDILYNQEPETVKSFHSSQSRIFDAVSVPLVASTMRGTDDDINKHMSADEIICNEDSEQLTTTTKTTRTVYSAARSSHYSQSIAGYTKAIISHPSSESYPPLSFAYST